MAPKQRGPASHSQSSSDAGSTTAPPSKTSKKDTAHASNASSKAQPSFTTHVLIPLAFAPLLYSGLIIFSRALGARLFESTPERPALVTLPFVGGSIGPVVLGLTIYLLRKRALTSFLPRLLAKILICLPAFLVLSHNFFTVLYGNINNDAWSDTLMIDVIGPPSTFKTFKRIPSEFSVATNAQLWANPELLDGPHLDIQTVHDAQCGPRSFARFMYHRILKKSRVNALLSEGVMFGGIWIEVDGANSGRTNKPKVFTDFAYGNDAFFNHLMRWILVDEFNWYSNYRIELSDEHWHIDSGLIAAYNNESVSIRTDIGAELEPKRFVMDQYSCMSEANWLDALFGRRWCFYKKMDADKSFELTGTMKNPLLRAGTVSFPSGDADDCSQPYVRGVLTYGLHWMRPTYEC